MGIAVLSMVFSESREVGRPAENNGAGGSGRLGLPGLLYREDGVPGLGLPFKSDGSYDADDAGGRG